MDVVIEVSLTWVVDSASVAPPRVYFLAYIIVIQHGYIIVLTQVVFYGDHVVFLVVLRVVEDLV